MRFVLALFIAVLAPTTQAQSPAPAPFAQLRQTWIANLQSRNLEAALALYTPDANFINADGTHTSTPAELRALYIRVFGAFTAKIQLTSRTTGQSGDKPGDLAFDSGSYSESITLNLTPSGPPHQYTGDYLII
jgi:ketosteroid isomerase-like protein